jgi:molecular chaperone HscB
MSERRERHGYLRRDRHFVPRAPRASPSATATMRTSYFAVLDLEPRFSIDLEQLERAYRAVATRVHPDRYATAPASEQREALALAADANEAYRTLKKPAPRATHLLKLRGIEVSAQAAPVTPAFLMEQMELREALDTARGAKDANALRDLQHAVRERSAGLAARLASLLDTDRDDVAAARSVQELMFIDKLTADIDEARALLEG